MVTYNFYMFSLIFGKIYQEILSLVNKFSQIKKTLAMTQTLSLSINLQRYFITSYSRSLLIFQVLQKSLLI